MVHEDTHARSIDETARRRFETAWRHGTPQPIEACLPPTDHPYYLGTLEELVHVELELSWKSAAQREASEGSKQPGQPSLVEGYLDRFPPLRDPSIVLRLLHQEYRVRHRFADRPSAAEYHERFPDVVTDESQLQEALDQNGRRETPPPDIPGYAIQQMLGRGGMGVVYKARHEQLDRTVALKMLLAGAYVDPEMLERFRTEATAAARLQHPNIVQVFDVAEHEGLPLICQEYVDGGNLAERIDGTPQPLNATAEIVETLARAIDLAHRRGIVHRDLKPPNVLLTGDGVPKIADFGLAKQFHDDAGQTATGDVLGTPSYMAPEQASGKPQSIGPATDVYALGAILYEMLSGRPPFRGETSLDTVSQVLTDEPVPPGRLRPKLPRDLETICLKCLEKEPGRRYTGAGDLADELRRYLDDRPILARPVGSFGRLVKWAGRRPAVAALTASIVLVTILGFAGVAWQWQVAVGARTDAEERADAETIARKEAEAAQRALAAALAEARRNLDFLRVSLADRQWQAAQIEAAERYLDACDPAHRHWEWHFLKWRCHSEALSLPEHGGSVRCLAFDPSGRWVASGDNATNLRISDAHTGETLRVLQPRHTDAVTGVTFSPDGKLLASASRDKTVKLWDVTTWTEVRTLAWHRDGVNSVAFSPDGKRLAAACGVLSEFGEVVLWNVDDGSRMATIKGHTTKIDCVAFDRDGNRLVTAGWDGAVKILNAADGQEIRTLSGHSGFVYSAAFSPDGMHVASVGEDRTVRLWDAATGQPVRMYSGHTAAVWGLAFSPDGKRLATCGKDRTVRVWDVASGREEAVLRGHVGMALCVAFSPDGERLASGGSSTVKIWDRTSLEDGGRLRPSTANAAIGPESRRLATAAGNDVIVFDLAKCEVLHTLRGPKEPVERVAFCRAGRPRVAAASRDGSVYVWDVQSGEVIGTFDGHQRRLVSGVVFSPDGKLAASCDHARWAGPDELQPGEVKVWDAETAEPQLTLRREHGGNVEHVAFSPGGKQVAAACDTLWLPEGHLPGVVTVWDAEGGRELLTLRREKQSVRTPVFSPDGKCIATSCRDGTADLWDVATGKQLATFRGPDGTVNGLAFSPDGKRLVMAGQAVIIWDAETGYEVFTPSLENTPGYFLSVEFSPDGKTLAASRSDNTVQLWPAPRLTADIAGAP